MLRHDTSDDLQRGNKRCVVVAAETEDDSCYPGVGRSPICRQWCDADSLLPASLDDVVLGSIEYQDSVESAVDRLQGCPR